MQPKPKLAVVEVWQRCKPPRLKGPDWAVKIAREVLEKEPDIVKASDFARERGVRLLFMDFLANVFYIPRKENKDE